MFEETIDVICPECSSVKVTGIQYRSVYDGILVWSCDSCGHAWPRFTGVDRRSQTAQRYADEWMQRRGSS